MYTIHHHNSCWITLAAFGSVHPGFGNNTASTTCTTPLSATTSATVTIALSIYTPDELIVTVTSVPSNVVTTCPFVSIPDMTLSPTTWWSKIFVRRGVLLKTLKSVLPGV